MIEHSAGRKIPLARRRPAIYIPETKKIRLMRLPRPFILQTEIDQNIIIVQQQEDVVLDLLPDITVNGRQLTVPKILYHGDIISLKREQFVYVDSYGKELVEICAEAEQLLSNFCSASPQTSELQSTKPAEPQKRTPVQRFPLIRDTVIGRHPKVAADQDSVAFEHPQVSASHARLSRRDGRIWIKDLKSRAGTFVNGTRIKGTVEISKDDIIAIGPYTIPVSKQDADEPPEFEVYTRDGQSDIVAYNLSRVVGRNKTILNDVTLNIAPKKFVCILGPSGSGKTTLLNALSAREPATSGDVYIGGIDLYRNFEMIKSDIAIVPQHDINHGTLTPRENLHYTAKLRLSDDISRKELLEQIEKTLADVGLITVNSGGNKRKTAPADTKIQRLSGGQQKRVSLANETVCRPGVLFLDEVTSGLDEETDWKIMELCRGLADEGLTVVCVTHTLVNVEEFCDQLLVLSPPGVLVFSGSPVDALDFFNVQKLGEIYRVLQRDAEKVPTPLASAAAWQNRFKESPYYREIPPAAAIVCGPFSEKKQTGKMTKLARAGIKESIRQFCILSGRNLRLLFRDRKTLTIAVTQSLVIAALLALVYENFDQGKAYSFLFLLGVTVFWLGCNNASKEIVKERLIYLRERDVNLSVIAYLASKSWVYGVVGALQGLLLFYGVFLFRDIPGDNSIQLWLLVLASVCGTAMGLLISAACSSQDQANTAVPLALVPQIILAGSVIPVLSDIAEWIAKTAITEYWVYNGLKKSLEDVEFSALLRPVSVQALHIVLFLFAAYLIMYFRDRRG